MDKSQCCHCQYFIQHYALKGGKIFRVYCGHCTLCNKPKRKQPDASVCEHFTPGENEEDAFATKEYLSKALLGYILRMELLPPIQDDPAGK